MRCKRILCAAVILSTVVPAQVLAWVPDRFELFCGKPYAWDFAGRARNVIANEFELGTSPYTSGFYLGRLGDDPDIRSAESCVSAGRKSMVEDYARHSLRNLKALGFASPSPDRLGPVVPGQDGQQVVRLYANENPSFAQTTVPCSLDGKHQDYLSFMEINPVWADRAPTPLIYRMLAHEFVHVIQNAQPFMEDSGTDNCLVPDWLNEGTADALSVYLLDKRLPGYRPPLVVKGSKSIYGLRRYDWAFTLKDSDTRDRFQNKEVPQYRSSSFWRYLADRFNGGKFDYLAGFYAVPDLQEGRDDWLDWLDAVLKNSDAGPQRPFYLIYPDFIANYATWGEKRFKNVGDETWLRESFATTPDKRAAASDGCHQVSLSPLQARRGLNLELEPISAQCIEVHVGGLVANQEATVEFMAFGGSEEAVDNLHLSVARMSGKIPDFGGADFNCYDLTRKMGGREPLCVTRPFTGRKGKSGEKSETTIGTWVKTWSTVPQQSDKAGELDNLYLFSHTPLRPTDRKHDNRKRQSTRLVVALDVNEFLVSSAPIDEQRQKKVESAVNRSHDQQPVPMTGSDPLSRADGIPSDPESLSKLPFMMNVKVPSASFLGDGISFINLTIADGTAADAAPSLQVSLQMAEGAIRFGSVGVFKAFFSGSRSEELESQVDSLKPWLPDYPEQLAAALGAGYLLNLPPDPEKPSAIIEVLEFSDELLHLRVSGKFCRASNWNAESGLCTGPEESFTGEILKPFGWAYDSAQSFVSFDTPGMKEYRKSAQRQMSGRIPVFPSGDRSSGPGRDAGTGAVGGTRCDCSCDAMIRYGSQDPCFATCGGVSRQQQCRARETETEERQLPQNLKEMLEMMKNAPPELQKYMQEMLKNMTPEQRELIEKELKKSQKPKP